MGFAYPEANVSVEMPGQEYTDGIIDLLFDTK